mmetsp:Transcript_22686/g.37284  ORF Transcript_22686/g.37284 Transcript_22686/m.37284 type:complete len:344 (-) Transcript_22686:1815-2846(-)
MLEFLARSARARLVTARIAPCRWIIFVKTGGDGFGGWCGRGGFRFGHGRLLLRGHFGQHLLPLFFRHGPDQGKLLCHFGAQAVQHPLEQLERFVLILVQRITLRITAEAHDRAQMFQRQQMFTPFAVDGLQDQLLFDAAHIFQAKGFGLFGHQLIAGFDQAFADLFVVHAFFFAPFDHRHIKTHLFHHCGIEALGIPLIRIGIGGHVLINQIINHLIAHVRGDLVQVFGLHDFAALAKDDLALVIHYIIKFQELLADVKVATLDLGLCTLQRFVHPWVHNRLAFLKAKCFQHLVQTVRAKDAHQVVFERQVERCAAGIALTTRTTAQLVVDTAAFVTLRGQNH